MPWPPLLYRARRSEEVAEGKLAHVARRGRPGKLRLSSHLRLPAALPAGAPHKETAMKRALSILTLALLGQAGAATLTL